MRFAGLGAAATLGVMLSVSVAAQTATIPDSHALKPHAIVSGPPSVGLTSPHGAVATDTAGVTRALVDINSASAVELGKVKFIGRKRAAAIISGRPWHHPDDLVAKKVVPLKYYDQIKDHLVAG